MRGATRLTTVCTAALLLCSSSVSAQAPAKARKDPVPIPGAPAVIVFEGTIVETKAPELPGDRNALASFFVKRGTVTKRFAVRLTGTPDEPKCAVLKGPDELEPKKVKGALDSPGRHVVVTHSPEVVTGTDAFPATRVLLGFTELAGGAQPLAELAAIDRVVGTGAEAGERSTVVVNYNGWLADGTMFDSSFGRGAFEAKLGRGDLIKAWDLGIPGMRVGGRRRLLVPARLGYGVRGAGRVIPSNAVLVFDIELIEVRVK